MQKLEDAPGQKPCLQAFMMCLMHLLHLLAAFTPSQLALYSMNRLAYSMGIRCLAFLLSTM